MLANWEVQGVHGPLLETNNKTLTQSPYHPGTLPSSANQCVLGNMYLKSILSRKTQETVWVGTRHPSLILGFSFN